MTISCICLCTGDSTAETVVLMEDSLMVLGSLMSNRFVIQFHVSRDINIDFF